MDAHSPMFEAVKHYYRKGMWSDNAVRNAVMHEWITADEYEEITGKKY